MVQNRVTLREKFEKFDKENPHVYKKLVDIAFIAKKSGIKKLSTKLLFEKLRWDYMVSTTHPDDEFRLNNSYTSFYARKIMKENPKLQGLFEIREKRGPFYNVKSRKDNTNR